MFASNPVPPHHVSRRIIVTGDDFGASPQVNQAIEEYHRAGALDQASLMVAAPCVQEAVEIAKRNPRLRVGLHLTLCTGTATRPSVLTDATGRFPESPAMAGLRYAFRSGLQAELKGEIGRQFELFRGLGLPPTYWDGHTHLHLHPVILKLTVPIAAAHGFKFTRLVRDPASPGILPRIFSALSAAAIPQLEAAGIGFADRVLGLNDTGNMSAVAFERAMAAVGEGTTEIYFHPGAERSSVAPETLKRILGRA